MNTVAHSLPICSYTYELFNS